MNVLVTIPACSQRPERQAHCRVRDDGVPVLHVEPICTRLRQLRVVLQELEQDDVEVVAPRPESKHVDTCKTKAQMCAKGTTQRAIHHTKKKKTKSVIPKTYPAREISTITVLINFKKLDPHRITNITDFH